MKKLIKHRGIHNEYIKENTLEGIKNALNDSKYDGVEFDIRCTKDNKFILFHNPIYNNKLISNINFDELPKYVPLLENILKIPSNKIFLIEIKNINNKYKELINLLKKYRHKNIYVMSFSERIINKMNIKDKTYKIGILNYVLNNYDIKKINFIGILNSLLNKRIINNLKDLEVFSYGIITEKKYDNIFYIVDK